MFISLFDLGDIEVKCEELEQAHKRYTEALKISRRLDEDRASGHKDHRPAGPDACLKAPQPGNTWYGSSTGWAVIWRKEHPGRALAISTRCSSASHQVADESPVRDCLARSLGHESDGGGYSGP